MTLDRAIEVIKNQIECAKRECVRECYECDLLLQEEDMIEAYQIAIRAIENIAKYHVRIREMIKEIDSHDHN